MRTITLGASPLQSSIMGFGCMGMSEFYGANHDDEASLRTLERAFELGITHYDTSNVYGRGANERLVGRFAQGKRGALTIATKFGVVRDPDGPEGSTHDRGIDNSPTHMRASCEESLVRLGVEAIDLYYVHRVDPAVPIEDTIGALAELVQEGKVRAIGLSEVSPDQLRRAHAIHPIAALQSEYSLWSREVEAQILPTCRELDICFVAYSPLGRGFLTGAIRQSGDLAPGDIRHTSPRFQGENLDRNRALLDHIADLCALRGITPGQLALAWLFHRDQNIVPIPGTKRIAYLEENVGALDVALSADELATIDELLPPGAAAGDAYAANYAGKPQPVED